MEQKDRDKVRAVTEDKQEVDDEEMLNVKISNTDKKDRRNVSFDTGKMTWIKS